MKAPTIISETSNKVLSNISEADFFEILNSCIPKSKNGLFKNHNDFFQKKNGKLFLDI